MIKGTVFYKNTGISRTFLSTDAEVLRGWYEVYSDKQTLRELAEIASIFKGGIFTDEELPRVKQLLTEKTDIEKFVFDVIQVKVQHKEVRIYCLDKEALSALFKMVGVTHDNIHTSATYYNGGHVWEVSKTTLEV